MKRQSILASLAVVLLACGSSSPDPKGPTKTPDATTTTAATSTTTAKPVEAAKEPSAEDKKKAEEEKKKAEAAKELAADRAKWETESKAEDTRFTAALHADAKKLAEAKYAS